MQAIDAIASGVLWSATATAAATAAAGMALAIAPVDDKEDIHPEPVDTV